MVLFEEMLFKLILTTIPSLRRFVNPEFLKFEFLDWATFKVLLNSNKNN